MGLLNAGTDGTAFPSLLRPLSSGQKLRCVWVSCESKVQGCREGGG